MCGIFGSFDKKVILSFNELNKERGDLSFSITTLSLTDEGEISDIHIHREMGKFSSDSMTKSGYYLVHLQTPTGSSYDIHPAEKDGNYLWHNGLIKENDMSRLQSKQKSEERWDTKLLLNELLEDNYLDNLSGIDGSFACIYLTNNLLYLFRNDLVPLFVNDRLDFSSVPWSREETECRRLPSNQLFQLAFNTNHSGFLVGDGKFTTRENPYFGL